MISIDDRIVKTDAGIFSEMLGHKLLSYRHDPLMYSQSVYGIAGLFLEDRSYAVTNLVEVRDYYGSNEDVAIFKISQEKENEIHSYVQGETFISTPVNQRIIKVLVINEHQRLFKHEQQTYDVWLTRGFIIELEDGLQISFEKDIWFSEDINISRGYHLEKHLLPTNRITDEWENPFRLTCEREIITFQKSDML